MNLLPENFKRELKHEAWRRFLVFFGTYVTLIEIVAITLLLPSFFFLRFQIDEFRKQRDAVLQGTDYRTMVDGKRSYDDSDSVRRDCAAAGGYFSWNLFACS